MKVTLDTPITNLAGTTITEDGKPFTIRTVVTNALLATYEGEQSLSGEQKAKRYALAMEAYKGTDEFTPEDVSLMKDLVGKLYGPLVVGQAYAVLNG